MNDILATLSAGLTVVVPVLVSTGAAWHALLFKRDPRSALGWVAICLAVPVIGAVFYFLFGVNRVRARAQRRPGKGRRWLVDFERGLRAPPILDRGLEDSTSIRGELFEADYPVGIARAAATITGRTLLDNNKVTILRNGEAAFPAMLSAIARARETISLTTYIFENNRTGLSFVRALADAKTRGVEVRVVIDGLGIWYSRGIARALRREDIDVQRFNPPRILPPALGVNLRNHRKILLVDNNTAFAGGMNIGDRHLLEQTENKNPTVDIQFCFEGPVAVQLAEIFTDTWRKGGGEELNGIAGPPGGCSNTNNKLNSLSGDNAKNEQGSARCRAIADGPDNNLDKLEQVFVAAMDSAQRSIRIMTPYFLPDQGMIAILQSAALRGLKVSVVLPAKNNLPYVHWATRNMLWELLSCGVKVYYQPGVFVHTKLLLVDEAYALVGSANIDPRSLRLNYELGVEIYDQVVVGELIEDFDMALKNSVPVTQDALDKRSLFARTRDALCWLASPYL